MEILTEETNYIDKLNTMKSLKRGDRFKKVILDFYQRLYSENDSWR